MSARTKLAAGATAVGVLIAGAVVAFALNIRANNQEDQRAAAASSSAASSSAAVVAAAEASSAAASSSAAAKTAADELERERRQLIVAELEKSVTKHAKKLVKDDLLDGPIKHLSCTPIGDGSGDLLLDATGQFSCMAVTDVNEDEGTESGYRYSATVNWTAESYTWHLGD